MNQFKLTREYISNKLPLEFSQGDSSILKSILFINEDEFKNWYGKDQYMRSALSLFSDIDKKILSTEYYSNRKIIEHAYRFCQLYNRYLITKKPIDRFIKFRYFNPFSNNCDCYIGIDFKVLDGLVLPIDDAFWNTYLPPNFVNDYCSVDGWYETDNNRTQIPDKLPIVDEYFKFDFKEIFFTNNEPYLE